MCIGDLRNDDSSTSPRLDTHPRPDEATPLRVCLIATHFAEYAFALAEALSRSAEVVVVASDANTRLEIGDAFVERELNNHVSHFLYHTRNPVSIMRQAVALVRKVRRFAPDVIHIQEAPADIVALALMFMPRRPLILTMHDPKPHQGMDSRTLKRTRRGFYVAALRRRADALIVHGRSLVADASEAVGGRSVAIHVIPHGPLGQRQAHKDAKPSESGRCLFFGRIEQYKGLDTFIAAIGRLREQGYSAHGVVAGRGSALDPWRPTLEVNESFELIDRYLPPEEAVREFQRAQVVVMPYREATQSGVAAFAMGVGRPVVAFDVGALRESIVDGETGLLVPAGDFESLVSALSKVLSDTNLRRQLGENALARANGEFAWSAIAKSHLNAYRSLCAGGDTSPRHS